MTRINTVVSMSFIGLGMLGLGILLSGPAGAAGDVTKAAPHDAATEATSATVKDTARDTAREAKRDEARDATREESPQQAANILKQTFAQLLMREDNETDRHTYGSQLMRGEKSVRAIVGLIASSPEFKEKWAIHSEVASAPSTAKSIDNVYCALLGRHNTSVTNVREGVATGGIERLIKDIIDSKEYAAQFGEQGVPHPSLNQQESSGCPQVS
jgi:Phycobilisome Linker polypeptide.